MRSAPILARSPQRRSDLQMRRLHPEYIYGTFRRSVIASSFLPITSLQPLHFHAIAHSFAQRRHAIPPILSSLHTLLPLTTNLFSPTHYFRSVFNFFPASSVKPRVLKDLQPLWHLQKSQVLCNQANPASFCKNTRVGGIFQPQASSFKPQEVLPFPPMSPHLPVRKAILHRHTYEVPAEGREKKLRLDFNENTAGCSPAVLRELAKMSPKQLAMYPEYLRPTQRLARYFGVRPDELLLTNGGDDALRVFFDTFVDSGSSILICEPTFPMYRYYAEISGAKVRAL